MKAKITTVTPSMARDWLRANTHNRMIRQGHVDFLAAEIVNARWKVTSQGIGFSESGTLIDGQHRLLAIVQANKPVEMLVTTGLTDGAQEVTDTGIRARTVGDQLHLADNLTDANLRSAACRQVVSMCCYFQLFKLSVGFTRLVHDALASDLTNAIECSRQYRPAKLGWVLGTFAFAMFADKRALSFVERFGSGEGLRKGDPVLSLRQWFDKRTSSNLKATWKKPGVECICNALRNSIAGESVTQIKAGVQGLHYFLGKKAEFVEQIRKLAAQQLENGNGSAS